MSSDTLSSKEVINRIARYLSLRGAERAIEPLLKCRSELPTSQLSLDLLPQLRRIKDAVDAGESCVDQRPVAEMAQEIDSALEQFVALLQRIILRTPMLRLRSLRALDQLASNVAPPPTG